VRPLRYLKSSFTPYEMAVIGYSIVIAMVIAAIGFVAMRLPLSSFVILQFLMLLITLPFWWFSRCPDCRKPAGVEYYFREDSILGSMERVGFYWNRMWPERECSNCRHQLDLFPEEQPNER
jgi:hypothetical protein